MQILFIGNNNHLMVEAHNYLSHFFEVHSVGFEQVKIEQQLSTLSVDLILISIKDVEKNDVESIRFLRSDSRWHHIKIAILGFTFSFHLYRRELMGADLLLTYPIKNEKLLEDICLLCRVDNPMVTGVTDENYEQAEEMMKHILVIDDDARMLRAVKSWLQGIYKVSVVNSSAAALVFLGKQIPDLILLDYEMPECDGHQMLEIIRQQKKLENIPVVFLTGVSDKERVKSVVTLNPQGYILKGVTRDEMVMKLSEIFSSI